jgi:hypothetical protein
MVVNRPTPKAKHLETESRLNKQAAFFRIQSIAQQIWRHIMNTQNQVKKAQLPQSEPSPWTEPFQRAHEYHEEREQAMPPALAVDSIAQNAAKSGTQEATATKRTLAAGTHPNTDEATHDALSTIFNG